MKKESLKSFISGKGYTRTKAAHKLSFLESNETTETFDTIEGEICKLETNDSCDLNLSKEISKENRDWNIW